MNTLVCVHFTCAVCVCRYKCNTFCAERTGFPVEFARAYFRFHHAGTPDSREHSKICELYDEFEPVCVDVGIVCAQRRPLD